MWFKHCKWWINGDWNVLLEFTDASEKCSNRENARTTNRELEILAEGNDIHGQLILKIKD